MPSIALDVVYFNEVDDSLLVYSSSESKKILVLETAKGNTGSGYVERSNHLPLIFLAVVSFAIAIDLIIHECANHIYEGLNCTERMVSMSISHACFLFQSSEQFVVAEAFIQVLVLSLDKPSN